MDAPVRNGGYVLLGAAVTIGLNIMATLVRQLDVTGYELSVSYELLVGAFGILWAAYNAARDGGREVVPPLIGVGVGFGLVWLSIGITTEAMPWGDFMQKPEHQLLKMVFEVGIPDGIAAFVLFWAVASARRMA